MQGVDTDASSGLYKDEKSHLDESMSAPGCM